MRVRERLVDEGECEDVERAVEHVEQIADHAEDRIDQIDELWGRAWKGKVRAVERVAGQGRP